MPDCDPDPLSLAEFWQDKLKSLDSMRPCADWARNADGSLVRCDQVAMPDGDAFEMSGIDFDGSERLFRYRKWRCAGGHSYILEED